MQIKWGCFVCGCKWLKVRCWNGANTSGVDRENLLTLKHQLQWWWAWLQIHTQTNSRLNRATFNSRSNRVVGHTRLDRWFCQYLRQLEAASGTPEPTFESPHSIAYQCWGAKMILLHLYYIFELRKCANCKSIISSQLQKCNDIFILSCTFMARNICTLG